MSARRLIVTVLLVLLPAGCAGTGTRDDSSVATSAASSGGQTPIALAARKRPAPPALPRAISAPVAPARQAGEKQPETAKAGPAPEPVKSDRTANLASGGSRESPEAGKAAGDRSPAGDLKTAAAADAGSATGMSGRAPIEGNMPPRTTPGAVTGADSAGGRATSTAGTMPPPGQDAGSARNAGQTTPAATAGRDVAGGRTGSTAGATLPPGQDAGSARNAGQTTPGATAGREVAGGRTGSTAGTMPLPGQDAGSARNAGQTTPGATAGRDVAGGRTGATAKAPPLTGEDAETRADAGEVTPTATASGLDEPASVATLRPGERGGKAGSATAGIPAKTIDPSQKPKPPSFEDRSLACDVVELMGKAIGRWRIRDEPRKPATDKAITEVLRQTGGVRDNRFVFSGRVYGMLIYQLTPDHTVEGFGAYAHSACLILRGGKGIVPADDTSDTLLDQALTICESGRRASGELNACISRRMENIVRQRGTLSGSG